MIWWLWIACQGASDTDPGDTDAPGADTDTGEIVEHVPASAADAVISGGAGASGSALAHGDVTGDGVEDLVVGGITGNRACVVPGPIPAAVDLSAAPCAVGERSGDYAGAALAMAGDVDGDGVEDVLIGAPGVDGVGFDAGRAYLVLGAPGGSLADAYAAFDGEASLDAAGTGVTSLGDMDGDGDVDLMIGAYGNDAGGSGAGRAYLIQGPIAPGPRSLATADTRIQGASAGARHAGGEGGDAVGWSVGSAGDVDGDGLPDTLISAGGNDDVDLDAGLVAVFFGPIPSGNLGLGAADARIAGDLALVYLGEPVTGAGDVDGDGLADLLLGSSGTRGRVYIVTATPSGLQSVAEVASTAISGETGDGLGSAVATGDLDGDGALDLVMGSQYDDLAAVRSGAVHVLAGPLPAGIFDVRDAATSRYSGEAGDLAGAAVAVGPFGGGASDDLAIGAPLAGAGAGGVYLFFAD